jgi:hypothetical protein
MEDEFRTIRVTRPRQLPDLFGERGLETRSGRHNTDSHSAVAHNSLDFPIACRSVVPYNLPP